MFSKYQYKHTKNGKREKNKVNNTQMILIKVTFDF
jgi:hypothetical protein